jgi:hypothetical protein
MPHFIVAALAALAATSAFAQSTVTITGKFGAAFEQGLGTSATAKGKANITVSDGDVNFTAIEDLGAGLKAQAFMGIRGRGRENAAQVGIVSSTNKGSYSLDVGRDAHVTLMGDFGSIMAGSIEAANGIVVLGYGGTNSTLTTDLHDGVVLSGKSKLNIAQYTSPRMSGFAVSAARLDSIGTVGQTPAALTVVGASADAKEANLGNYANQLALSYVNGPLAATLDYTLFGGSTTIGTKNDRKRTRVSASYDFGVVRIGAGMEDNTGSLAGGAFAANKGTFAGTQAVVGASVPFGALRVGVVYMTNSESAVFEANGAKATGYGISADYSLSKRTTVNFSYGESDRRDLAKGSDYSKEGSQTRLRLMHSF